MDGVEFTQRKPAIDNSERVERAKEAATHAKKNFFPAVNNFRARAAVKLGPAAAAAKVKAVALKEKAKESSFG